jgi:sulfate transport system ATP-binding protein
MSIEVVNVSKSFNTNRVLHNISLKVNDGELVALLGPSGSGKTTLLRIMAGLEVPDEGEDSAILFHGENVASHKVGGRRVGFVFQHYALFRHMTVFENVAFGLRVRPRKFRPSKQEIRDKVMNLLKLIQLEQLGPRYPSQLSGGQRQRVALARALAIEPKVLLLDEPFGALDARVRKDLRQWLRHLHDSMKITSVFVTHDQEEALEVADRVVVMNQGRIEQVGTPEEVYHHPVNPFVSRFIGEVNLFHERTEDDHTEQTNGTVFVRPHLLKVHRNNPGTQSFSATVEHINPAHSVVKIELRTPTGDLVRAEMTHEELAELNLQRGQEVFLTFKSFQVFEEDYAI